MTRRLKLLQALFLLWAVLIVFRLGYWQIFKSSELKAQAQFQQTSSLVLPATRGEIKSADGFPLVTNDSTYLLHINPQQFFPDRQTVEELTGMLPSPDTARQIIGQADGSGLQWLALAHYVPSGVKERIESKNIPGLGFEPEPVRMYPEGSPSAYITGFVGKNESGEPQGYFGLEGFYDRLLTGKSGRLVQERDAFNRPIVIGSQNRIPPQNGRTLVTSIDRTIQNIAWQKLKEGLETYQAVSGTVSIMEPNSGRVLAMVSLPGYDQARFTDYDPALYKNPIVSDSYEPGSTFKTIVMASALDAGAVKPNTVCTICSGPVRIGEYSVRSWNEKYYPGSTMTDVILHSDNVGMVFVSRNLGKTKMLDYIRRFGFGKMTGIDMQEESISQLRPDDQWREIDWATASFGQGIAVTPLQMLTAVNAIAGLGQLAPPRIVTEIVSDSGTKIVEPPRPVRVISPEAAVSVTQMMVNGAQNGEVRYYKPAGYMVAGKTGTAQVPIEGHYDKNKTIASFIGFAPADNPRFTMLVTLREPKTSPWGSTTAAPVWFNIARELFRYYRIPPNFQ